MSDQYVTEAGWDVDISCELLCSDEVVNTNDDGWGSLRRTILCADPAETINISSDIFSQNLNLASPITIDKNVVIDVGAGNQISLISLTTGPAFHILGNGQLELDYINIISGTLNNGGAIINDGNLILKNVDIFQNENVPDPLSLIENNGTITIDGNSSIIKE